MTRPKTDNSNPWMTQPVYTPQGELYPRWVVISDTGNLIASFTLMSDCKAFLRAISNSGESISGWLILDNREQSSTYGELHLAEGLLQCG